MFFLLSVAILAMTQSKLIRAIPPLQDVSLFPRASKVPNIKADKSVEYVWVDNTHILVGKEEGEKRLLSLALHDIRSGVVKPLTSINQRLADQPLQSLGTWDLSPNGKRLLVIFRDSGFVVGLNGEGYREIDARGYHSSNCWFNDQHWLHAFDGTNGHLLDYMSLSVNDIANPHRGYGISNSQSNPMYTRETFCFGATGQAYYSLNSSTISESRDLSSGLLIYRRPVGKKDAATRVSVLNFKRKVDIKTAILSPDCRRMAVLHLGSGLPLSHKAGREAPRVLCLWVADVDGRKAREVGCVICGVHSEDVLTGVHWLPDGKRLSFSYRGSLYIVPADGPDFSQFVSRAPSRSK